MMQNSRFFYRLAKFRAKVRSQHVKNHTKQIVFGHPALGRLMVYHEQYLSTSPLDGKMDHEKIDFGTNLESGIDPSSMGSQNSSQISIKAFAPNVVEEWSKSIDGGSFNQSRSSYEALDEYTARKKLLVQYLQNELWHQVDRIVDVIEQERGRQCSDNHVASLGNLRKRVERHYLYKKRATQKFVASKNWERLQERKRRRRELQVVHESNSTVGQDDSVIVPTKFLGDAELNMLHNVANPNFHNVNSSKNTSTGPASLNVVGRDEEIDRGNANKSPYTSSSDNFAMKREKNRLLSLLDESEYINDRSKSIGDERDFATRRQVTDTKVTLLDLLDDDYYYDEKAVTENNTDNLLDLLDDRVSNHDDFEQYYDDGKQRSGRGGLLSLLDDMKDLEPNAEGNQKVAQDQQKKHFLDMSDAKSTFELNLGDTSLASTSNHKSHKKEETKSLLEMLNDDNYTDESNIDGAKVASIFMEKNQTENKNLLDLFNNMKSVESDMDEEHLMNIQKQQKQSSSLLTFLDAAEPHNSDSYHLGDKANDRIPEAMIKTEAMVQKHKIETTSLLDLLDDECFNDEILQVTKSQDVSRSSDKKSLVDMLQEDDTYSRNQEPASSFDFKVPTKNKGVAKKQGSSKSHSGLLDEDEIDEKRQPLNLRLDSSQHGIMTTRKSNLEPIQDKNMGDQESGSSNNTKNSLLDLLEYDFEDANRIVKSSDVVEILDGADSLIDQGETVEHMKEILVEDVEESFSTREALNKAQSLLSVMQRNDWDALHRRFKGSQPYRESMTGEINLDHQKWPLEAGHCAKDAKESNEDRVEQYVEESDAKLAHFIIELLEGSSFNKWILCADEFNVLLLHVATSNDPDKIEKLLDIFLHMKELESSGRNSCGPNADTFAIIFSFLERFPGASSIAYDIAKEMIDNIYILNDSPSIDTGYGQNEQKFTINEECLNAAMRIFTKRLDIYNAERLMHFSLDFGEGVRVSPNVFGMMLLLYKCENLQDKAADLIKKCIEENNADSKGLNKFLLNASVWPKYKRDGSKIVLGPYLDNIMNILDYMTRQEYFVSSAVWKSLLGMSARVARTESESYWSTAHRCCKALISYDKFPNKMNEQLLLIGLEASEKMQDPQLTADLICCSIATASSEDGMDSIEGLTGSTSHIRLAISPKTCIKAIKLCIDSGSPAQSERILRHCYRRNLPPKVLSDMYAMVLAGYVQNGNTDNVETLFGDIKSWCIRPSEAMYAAYLHHLGANKEHDKVMSILNSMLNGSNDDTVTPGISCFSSGILSAIKSRNYKDAINLEAIMREKGLQHNLSTCQGVLIANARLGGKQEVLSAIDSALQSKSPMDSSTFMLCLRYIIPQIMDKCGHDVEAIRTYLRSQVQSNPGIAHEAMELSKSLKTCLREDGRKPSKMNNQAMVDNARSKAWRSAVRDAVYLSKALPRNL